MTFGVTAGNSSVDEGSGESSGEGSGSDIDLDISGDMSGDMSGDDEGSGSLAMNYRRGSDDYSKSSTSKHPQLFCFQFSSQTGDGKYTVKYNIIYLHTL